MLDTEIIEIAKNIYNTEIKSLELRMNKLSENFVKVVRKIYDCKGKVVVTGLGKTGIIGKKISATFASTGTTSIFMNSTEGLHGDLGIINPEDIVLAISNSGESDEILAIMPAIKNIGAYIIAMTGNINSRLAKASDLYINTHVEEEGCPINLAPMSSTTNALVMGDALAGCLMKLRNFSPQNFAMYHPGGSLGRKLLTHKEEFFKLKDKDIMTTNYTKVDKDDLATQALSIMEDRPHQINVLPVFDKEKFVGVIRIHDLLKVR